MRRTGYTLVEIMVVLAVIAMLSIPLAHLSRALFKEMPRSGKVIDAQASLINCLNQIRRDINVAKSFPAEPNGSDILSLQMDDGLIYYSQKDERIIRSLITDDNDIAERQWYVCRGKLEFDVWRKDGEGYAVAVKSYIADKVSGRIEKKMQNSHLYFVNAYSGTENEKAD